MQVAINGFGRIGRTLLRILAERKDIQVVAINDIADNQGLVYLFKYDTVMGTFKGEMGLEGDTFRVNHHEIRMTAIPELSTLPWRELEVDFVVEATGRFRTRAEIARHLDAGAKRVVLTVPAKDEIDATVVLGVNDHILRPEHRLVSNASCTTNCLAPVAKVLDERFGIVKGIMTTVHAYTNDQRLADVPHKDLRRSRAAAENIIPTTTGAAKAVGKVLPNLQGKLDGIAMRVPVPDGSIVDLVTEMAKPVTVEAVNSAIAEAAAGPMRTILQYSTEPIVSSDVIGNSHSSIFDSLVTSVLGERLLKTIAWYDNEWGYSCRVVDLMERLGAMPLEIRPPEK
ncbi:MAG: type I glyceraldehyde-3-phosphate dehydrogenase [Candidatus Eisenbacteria bacterium]